MSHPEVSKTPKGLYINGAWRQAAGAATFDVFDPADGAPLASVSSASVADALDAVSAAHAAGPAWAATAPRQRGEILRTAYTLLMRRQEEFARLIVLESGKALAEARGEVAYAAEFLRWYAEEAVRICGEVSTAPGGANRIMVLRQPIGVAVLVTPWNFPAAMATRKIGPALAAGCTVVLKPASETPLTALLLAELFAQAGVPAGVINVVPSRQSGEIVHAMLHDARVRKLSFTGSTEIGRVLLAQAADKVVKCSMELGGNAPFIVLDDADLELAVASAMVAKLRNGGESCTAANRFYVARPVAAEFSRRLAAAMAALTLGPGLDPAVQLGPLVNRGTLDKVARLVDEAVAQGATVLTGGRARPGPGFFYEPTLLADVRPDARILRQEIFGPVAPVCVFDTVEEAIALANDTEFGLVAFVHSRDLARALAVAERIEAGMVGINRGVVSDPAAPFGGWKQSGVGREGGHDGLLAYLESKYICVSW
ncbi:aldehyde dehydrogenase family protein [Duganella sp. FT50W]|uniref:Aldehyde dehydrogenase family protein n=1 Tax=Duganella lactea TaxID=2692173 RepID=A0A6L8MPY9_9BURK|nr:NAD-dependent succinate-semialdehyde dehydrogenase [Duganella lactea]MYM34465.1 aldehyde dehydrogenase family protein [Duganella lactea]MYM81848.1 aldehyde dehydrogenase family protein [Duganella lactea]